MESKIFISRKKFLEMFNTIDNILAETNLNSISNNALTKSLCKDITTARYVRKHYPDILAVYRIIYDKYDSINTIWENAKGDITYLVEPIHKPRNRWHEFKKFMSQQKKIKSINNNN